MGKYQEHYLGYINSATWREKRELVLARDGRKCQRCPATTHLHVHHLTYKNFGHEDLAELLTLCADCHKKEHEERDKRRAARSARKKLKRVHPKSGICRSCQKIFQPRSFPKGGGVYCSRRCKALSKPHKKILVDPATLRAKGTEAAIEETHWKKLA